MLKVIVSSQHKKILHVGTTLKKQSLNVPLKTEENAYIIQILYYPTYIHSQNVLQAVTLWAIIQN